MWPYYGSKSKIVHLYPKPKFDRIIEPFAGTARYSLLYWDHDITLVDKDKKVVGIWKWFQQCSREDILRFPVLKKGDRVSKEMFDCEEAFNLGRFLCSRAGGNGRWTVTEFGEQEYRRFKKRTLSHLHKIKNWNIVHGSYEDLENMEATWFIDPPYQYGGEGYTEGNKNLDFQSLAEWCRTRKGQVIVCENTKADWLPFYPMKMINGVANTFTTEAIWSNLPTDYDVTQLSFFQKGEYEKKIQKPRQVSHRKKQSRPVRGE